MHLSIILKESEMKSNVGRLVPVLMSLCLILSALQSSALQTAPPVAPAAAPSAQAASLLDRLPLDFVPNRGQWAATTQFVAQRGPLLATFERSAIKLDLGLDQPVALGLTFEGASANTTLV